ncbi:MAG: hypothetical protein ABFD92_19860 [Planctomycetaceae bacterium]
MHWLAAILAAIFSLALLRLAGRPGPVFFGGLKVMPHGNLGGVADPPADGLHRVRLGKLCLAGAAKVLEQLAPGRHARPLDDLRQLRAQVLLGVAIAGDNVLRAFGRLFKHVAQVRQDFREDRHLADTAVRMVLRLVAVDCEPIMFPVNVHPLELQHFRGAAQAAIAGQGEDQLPLGIRAGRQHRLRLCLGHVIEPLGILAHDRCLPVEWIVTDQPLALCRPEELLGNAHASADRVIGQGFPVGFIVAGGKVNPESVGVAGRDRVQPPAFPEEVNQAALGVAVDRAG